MTETPTHSPVPPLQGVLVDLLRESPLGLTPASLLEVLREKNLYPEEGVSDRGLYQRVLRALQQLETMGVVRRSGRRYLLDVAAADASLEQQTREVVERALQETTLTADPERLRTWLDRAFGTFFEKQKSDSA